MAMPEMATTASLWKAHLHFKCFMQGNLPIPQTCWIEHHMSSGDIHTCWGGSAGWAELRARRQRYVVQCLGSIGEYMECLALVLAADGIGIVQRLLHAWRERLILLADLLRLLVALLVHRRHAGH